MNRLVIIDGNAIMHRAFHALPPLTTKNGEVVNAVFGFTSMLLRVIQDLKPTYVIVTFDRPQPTFRKALYVGYQAHRPKMDESLSAQIEKVHRVVETMGIPIFEMDGYEADDVIGTLAFQASGRNIKYQISNIKYTNKKSKIEEKTETIIVTGDRDILQLVDDKIKAYMPVKGLSEAKLYGAKEVEERFGIKPKQIVDYKALVGDPSDNYPGVTGVGPKTASQLILQYGSLENVYKHIGKIASERLRKTLAENFEQAELAKKLATIVRDVPITLDLEKCRLKNLDRPHIHKMLEDLEFRSLITRLSANNQKTEELKKLERKKKEDNTQQIRLF